MTGALLAAALLPGCMSGPLKLQETRLHYNEVVKTTTEQQLLLNIVRLRYTTREFVRAFRLKPGLAKYDVTVDVLPPFSQREFPGGFTVIDLGTRSLLMELTRLDLQAKPGDRPLLTLPLSR